MKINQIVKLNLKLLGAICFISLALPSNAATEKAVKDKVAAVAKQKAETQNKAETTTGFMQEINEPRPHVGPDRSGAEVYEFRCKGCHARNTQGAPLPDDQFEWQRRLNAKGIQGLMAVAMNGTLNTLMPPKGGCRNCDRKEVEAAVYYMLKSANVKVPSADKTAAKK